MIWSGLDQNDTKLQRSTKSLMLHLAYLTLFLVFEAVNLLNFYQDYESDGEANSGTYTVIVWTLWSAFELFNRLVMMFCIEEMNKRYEEYLQ